MAFLVTVSVTLVCLITLSEAASLVCPSLYIANGQPVPETQVGQYARVLCNHGYGFSSLAPVEYIFCGRHPNTSVTYWAGQTPSCQETAVKIKGGNYSCEDIRQEGRFQIDPDGPGDNSPFEVDCVRDGQAFVTTVAHSNPKKIQVQGPLALEWSYAFAYNVDMVQLDGLSKLATSCRQYTKLRCYDMYAFAGYDWWYSRQGYTMMNWGGAPTNSSMCACGVTDTCEDGQTDCNCNRNDQVNSVDEGYLDDKRYLPVTKVRLHDLDQKHENADLIIGKLECRTNQLKDLCSVNNGQCSHGCVTLQTETLQARRQCTCPAGMKLSKDGITCIDINECANLNGGCDHICTNARETYTCSCKPGYKLGEDGHTCTDINECLSQPCDHLCINLNGSFQCACRSGYRLAQDGTSCEDVDECSNNDGVCEQVCNNTPGSYFCGCFTGYKLDSNKRACNDIDECSVSNGQCSDKCVNTIGSYHCECPVGYELSTDNKTCQDINECARLDHTCHICANTVGSFKCHCNDGFTLTKEGYYCIDVDECKLDKNDPRAHKCKNADCITNRNGGYDCKCWPGYSLNKDNRTCTDIDECAANNGGCSHYCSNSVGSYQCTCRSGYVLQGDNKTCVEVYTPSTTKGCKCQLRLKSNGGSGSTFLVDLTTLIYGETKVWYTDGRDRYQINEKFKGFYKPITYKPGQLPTSVDCLKVYQNCPKDCEKFSQLSLNKVGLATTFNTGVTKFESADKGQLGHILCKKLNKVVNGQALVSFFNPQDCGPGSSTFVLQNPLCCSVVDTPIGTLLLWDETCKGGKITWKDVFGSGMTAHK